MITVDIYVPYSNQTYDFTLEETASISALIEEIVPAICAKEQWPMPGCMDELTLFCPAYQRGLCRTQSLADQAVVSGQRLILC